MARDFGLSQIGQIAVPVQDLDRAVDFYRDRLGMQFLFQVPNMAFFDCAGVRLMLGLPEEQEASQPASPIYYRVEDIDAAQDELAGRGVVLSRHHTWWPGWPSTICGWFSFTIRRGIPSL